MKMRSVAEGEMSSKVTVAVDQKGINAQTNGFGRM
jgi:hypothetical protein